MTALPFEDQDDEARVREEARLHAISILRGRTGIIRSLGTDAMRSVVGEETPERIGVPGSRATED